MYPLPMLVRRECLSRPCLIIDLEVRLFDRIILGSRRGEGLFWGWFVVYASGGLVGYLPFSCTRLCQTQ